MKFLQKYSVVGLILAICFALISPFSTNAVSYTSIEDTISDSDLSATNVTHTIIATTTIDIDDDGGYIEFVFPSGFTTISSSSLTCPGTASSSQIATSTVACVYNAPNTLAAGPHTFTLASTTNPGTAGSYTINAYSRASTTTEIESGAVKVAILNDVTVTATVDPSLTFNVAGMSSTTVEGGDVNGVTLSSSGSSTYDTIPFGTLTPNSSSTIGQALTVSTNATHGFSVTVAQNNDLTSGGNATINAFVDGTASTTAQAWQSPAGTLGSADTYGHFGITSDDAVLSELDFGSAEYKGFNGATPMEIMYNDGPANATSTGVGYTEVAYTIEVSALQEAGDYENTLTYVCTPTY